MTTSEILRREHQAKETKRRAREHKTSPPTIIEVRRGRRIIRPKEAWQRLGCGHDKFYRDYVNTGRLKLITLGKHSKGIVEDELDDLIGELIEERDAAA